MKLAPGFGRQQLLGVLFCVSLAFALGAASAEATLLPANITLQPTPLQPSLSAPDIGGLVLATQSPTFTSSSYSGTLTTTVERDDPSNPFVNGTYGSNPDALTFIYKLTNENIEGASGIQRLSVYGYGNYAVDGSYVAAGGYTAPTEITRSSDDQTVGFNFQNRTIVSVAYTLLNPGSASVELVLHTNAEAFTTSSAANIGSAITDEPTYVPVPEPTSLLLAMTGLAAFIALGWRRRAQQNA